MEKTRSQSQDQSVDNIIKIVGSGLIVMSLMIGFFMYVLYSGFKSLSEPREISYAHVLPGSAEDVHEFTDYFQAGPDEEYQYYLKAKVSEEEFNDIVDELNLEWASPLSRSVSTRVKQIPWWNPPSSMFLYAKGNGADYIVQADYIQTTGYVFIYVQQY